jgi:hypothetical protein
MSIGLLQRSKKIGASISTSDVERARRGGGRAPSGRR